MQRLTVRQIRDRERLCTEGASPQPEAQAANKIPEANVPAEIKWLDAPPAVLCLQHEENGCCYKAARPQHLRNEATLLSRSARPILGDVQGQAQRVSVVRTSCSAPRAYSYQAPA